MRHAWDAMQLYAVPESEALLQVLSSCVALPHCTIEKISMPT